MWVKSSPSLRGCFNILINQRPIGLFDSGAGGLSILQALRAALPNESFIYFADTAKLPYGEKEDEEIIRCSLACASFLFQNHCKLLIAACHTASTLALSSIEALSPLPIIGVAKAGVEAATAASLNRRIALLATKKTVESGFYQNSLKNYDLLPLACPLLVSLVEKGDTKSSEARKLIKEYLLEIEKFEADTILLGCTHFHFLRPLFEEETSKRIVDCSSFHTAHVARLLKEKNLAAPPILSQQINYFASGNIDAFMALKELLVDQPAYS